MSLEKDRIPVERPGFKPGEGRSARPWWVRLPPFSAILHGSCRAEQASTPLSRDVVLIGGGHAHVEVLRRFGMRPHPGVRLTVVARDVQTPYSGMLPGLVAGHYAHDDCHVDLQPLCDFAAARLYQASAVGLDLARRLVLCDQRPPVPFDLLSIDVGSTPRTQDIAGADTFAIPVKPVDRFLLKLEELAARVRTERGPEPFRLVIVGGGAGGFELALALKRRLGGGSGGDRVQISLVSMSDDLIADRCVATRRRAKRLVRDRKIQAFLGRRVRAITADQVICESGEEVRCDAVVLATHAAAPQWLRTTGLSLDEAGFVQVGQDLQSVSQPAVFAAGDVAALSATPLLKSGVYAVRQGSTLAENLRRALEGSATVPYRPQPRALALISGGERYGIASYGQLAAEGRWVWRLKDWIDRRWMAKYRDLPEMAASDGEPEPMRCGGCGAKVPSRVLRQVLDKLEVPDRPDVVCGLGGADDAALLRVPDRMTLVQTVDQFRAFIDDPYTFGRVTANHCLGDIYAMGAEPRTAQALVSLPFGPEDKLAADLEHLLRGALATLGDAGVVLVGGHTGEAAELTFGLVVNGLATTKSTLCKGGMRCGDRLILTKPLGTGAILAARMRRRAKGRWVGGAVEAMLTSNRGAASCLQRFGATACTDVTGFGLLGHLTEMLRASGTSAEVSLAALPALEGAVELLGRGVISTLHPANLAFASAIATPPCEDDPRYGLMFDPQTAGGLLASVPKPEATACVAELRRLGYSAAAVIGRVTAGDGPVMVRVARGNDDRCSIPEPSPASSAVAT